MNKTTVSHKNKNHFTSTTLKLVYLSMKPTENLEEARKITENHVEAGNSKKAREKNPHLKKYMKRHQKSQEIIRNNKK